MTDSVTKPHEFTFYWLDGKREVLSGDSASDALNRAGYGAGAVRALDFYAVGNNDTWVWDKRIDAWERRDAGVEP